MNAEQHKKPEEPSFRWTSYTITHVLDCIADPRKNRIIVELSDDISAIFPYLNALYPIFRSTRGPMRSRCGAGSGC
ncbi:MAG: hypothetical protein ACP5TV_06120 [Anaerolineae bacterium]